MKRYQYIISGTIFLGLIITIIAIEVKGDYFNTSTEEVFQATLNNQVFISKEVVNSIDKGDLIINLDSDSKNYTIENTEATSILVEATDLLSKENLKIIKDIEGKVILNTKDMVLATNSWVILSKKGYENIWIYREQHNEKLEHAFTLESADN